MMIDPDGRTVKPAGEKEKEAYESYKNKITGEVSAYDAQTAKLRDKGTKRATRRANRRDKNRSSNIYVNILGELNAIEASEDVFTIRMGDNVSNDKGGGNLSYNSSTNEIDVNLSKIGDFSTTQKMAHELTHAAQYLDQRLDLHRNGGGGVLYDQTDEVEAFERQNLFLESGDSPINAREFAAKRYSGLPSSSKTYGDLKGSQKLQYNASVVRGVFKIGGWRKITN